MRIGICDDEKIISDELLELCYKYMERSLIKFELVRFSSGEELLKYNESIDILFLDIQMKGLNGISTAMELRERDDSMLIIFVTAFRNFMQDGYRVRAFRYLLKPIVKRDFMSALDEAVKDMNRNSKTIVMKDGSIMCIKIRSILYVEYVNHKTIIRTRNNYYETRHSLRQWEDVLNTGDFYRVHKAYIVNMGYVEKVDNLIITLENNEKVELSQRNKRKFKEAMLEYRMLNAR